MKEKVTEYYGSLREADQQIVKLKQDGTVHRIYSEDRNIIALGEVVCIS